MESTQTLLLSMASLSVMAFKLTDFILIEILAIIPNRSSSEVV